jgi:hypothetical protein
MYLGNPVHPRPHCVSFRVAQRTQAYIASGALHGRQPYCHAGLQMPCPRRGHRLHLTSRAAAGMVFNARMPTHYPPTLHQYHHLIFKSCHPNVHSQCVSSLSKMTPKQVHDQYQFLMPQAAQLVSRARGACSMLCVHTHHPLCYNPKFMSVANPYESDHHAKLLFHSSKRMLRALAHGPLTCSSGNPGL